ncbi:MAG: DNA primase [Candidatus Wildermuthbacteria bacterium]|nr:DNA primase [Candidatus Wildermuthbacteria bacterium]
MLFSPVEEIKSRLEITAVLASYIKLQKAGANWRALCPFHSEKTPSFFVSPARQVWRCFGCSAHGDVFNFVMQIEGLEFGDALRQLAQKAGVELQKASPLAARIHTEKKRLSEVAELAAKFFEKQLSSKAGLEAKEYLKKRGLTEESIVKWRLGYAPESASALFDFLKSKGYQESDIARAGLLVRSGSEVYDRFRSRIIFPILDMNSHVAGFGGRIFGQKAKEKEIAKYLNTSNTPLYDKSRILYGLDQAKLAIRQQDKALLVEGYMDEILVSQAGSENAVAVSGTALTIFHLKVLKRYTENLLLSFDMDLGGDTATRRGIDLAIGEGFNVKVVVMEQGKDPADVVAENPQVWKNAVENAKSIFDFYFQTAFEKFDRKSPEGKKEIAQLILPLIKRIPNKIEQSHWVARLAKDLQVKEEHVEAELKKLPEEEQRPVLFSQDQAPLKGEPRTRKQMLEERVFVLLCKNPALLEKIDDKKIVLFFIESQEILEAFRKNKEMDFAKFDQMLSQEHSEFLRQMALQASVEDWEKEGEDADSEFKQCMSHLEQIHIRSELDNISQAIKEAEEEKNAEKLKSLVSQFQELSKSLHLLR